MSTSSFLSIDSSTVSVTSLVFFSFFSFFSDLSLAMVSTAVSEGKRGQRNAQRDCRVQSEQSPGENSTLLVAVT